MTVHVERSVICLMVQSEHIHQFINLISFAMSAHLVGNSGPLGSSKYLKVYERDFDLIFVMISAVMILYRIGSVFSGVTNNVV